MSSSSSSATTAGEASAVDLVPLSEVLGLSPTLPAVQRASAGLRIPRGSELHTRLAQNDARGMEPGQLVEYDFRHLRSSAGNNDDVHEREHRSETEQPPHHRRPLRVITWNIERGYKLEAIIALLQEQDADIIALQELDVGCARSSWSNNAKEIAQALGMQVVFVPEFNELYSPLRPASAQGGGVHGNAILSRYPLECFRVLRHEHQYFDWERRGHEKREPRLGGRFSVSCIVQTPQGPIRVTSVHMEVFAGLLSRLVTLGELFDDARDQRALARLYPPHGIVHQMILGDFNTLSHGIARCSAAYSTDSLRWGSLGWTEAEWVTKHVLHSSAEHPPKLDRFASVLPPATRAALTNDLGFIDPFDSYACSTLSNYKSWFQGKLDWMLLAHCTVQRKWTANDDFSASDHKLLGCEVTLDEPVNGGSSTTLGATTTDAAAAPSPSRSTKRRRSSLRSRRASGSGVMPLLSAVSAASAAAADAASPAACAAGTPPVYAKKSSADLRRLMPLTRPRPGIVTSSSTNVLVYGPQIAAFWAAAMLLAWMMVLGVKSVLAEGS